MDSYEYFLVSGSRLFNLSQQKNVGDVSIIL